MGKSKKLLERFLRRPKDFTYKELETLLVSLGFTISNAGSASGSAVRFIDHSNGNIIRIHRPHPQPQLKGYVVSAIISDLQKGGYLDAK